MAKVILCTGVILQISGCYHLERGAVTKVLPGNLEQEPQIVAAKEREARLADVPVPVTSILVPLVQEFQAEQKGFSLKYLVEMSAKEVADFYIKEMVHLGWKKSYLVCDAETLICFERPDRFCAVSICKFKKDLVSFVLFVK